MPRALAAAALLALSGCSGSGEPAAGPTERTAVSQTPVDASRASAEPSPRPGSELPPAGAERRYVGRWASRADLCEGGAWVFERDRFGMEDGPMCDFEDVSEIPGGYRIVAQCEGPRGERSQSAVTLKFAESARAMLVKGLATLPDTGLVYCGPA